ncbi:MAG TPA: GFA family protein, partial [Solirubrobacteraceae bacterium]
TWRVSATGGLTEIGEWRDLGECRRASIGSGDRRVPHVHATTGTDNGNPRERLFCGEWGSPLFTMLAEQPEIAIIKAGTLDDRSGLVPTAELWGRRAHEWLGESPDRARFEGDLPPR